jgi:hypothetical protein
MAEKKVTAETLAAIDEATENIAELFAKYGVTKEEIEKALSVGAEAALAKCFPELVEQAK